MVDKKADKKSPVAPPPVKLTPEQEANARISELQVQVTALEYELRTLRGRLNNRSPKIATEIKKENQILRTRVAQLQKALYALMIDSLKARSPEEAKQDHEVLRQSIIEYCKKNKLDPVLWKNIAY
jgi:hypothetical protein